MPSLRRPRGSTRSARPAHEPSTAATTALADTTEPHPRKPSDPPRQMPLEDFADAMPAAFHHDTKTPDRTTGPAEHLDTQDAPVGLAQPPPRQRPLWTNARLGPPDAHLDPPDAHLDPSGGRLDPADPLAPDTPRGTAHIAHAQTQGDAARTANPDKRLATIDPAELHPAPTFPRDPRSNPMARSPNHDRTQRAPSGHPTEPHQQRLQPTQPMRPTRPHRPGETSTLPARPSALPTRSDRTRRGTSHTTATIGPDTVAPKDRPRGDLLVRPVTASDERRIHAAIREGFEAVGFQRPNIKVVLKPHAGLRGAIERSGSGKPGARERLTIELTDAFIDTPEIAVSGIAAYLGLRVLPKRVKRSPTATMLADYYDEWLRSKDARELHSSLRKARARKQGRGPRGEHLDLDEIKRHLARRYFGNRLRPVKTTWSSRAGYRTFGHHDADLDLVVVSRALDHPDVPEAVTAFVLYHELLHHHIGIKEGAGGCRQMHTPAFRRRERRFPNHAAIDAYLELMCARRKAVSRQRAPAELRSLWDAEY